MIIVHVIPRHGKVILPVYNMWIYGPHAEKMKWMQNDNFNAVPVKCMFFTIFL